MIQKFIDLYEKNKHEIREKYTKEHPEEYKDIVTAVIHAISKESDYETYDDRPSTKLIHEIDDGDYQGTKLYLIASAAYQPSKYWYCFVDYGSCSGCDTLERVKDYSSEPPTKGQTDGYMLMALHIVQSLKMIDSAE